MWIYLIWCFFLLTGLSIHTFHGNFFVRSTDLLSLPNISPDAGFGVQVSVEDNLDVNYVSFQAALLYTSSKGKLLAVHRLDLLLGGELPAERCRTDDLMPSISLLCLPPCRVNPKILWLQTTIMSSLPHYIHHLTGGDPPVIQEPLGWERLGRPNRSQPSGSWMTGGSPPVRWWM